MTHISTSTSFKLQRICQSSKLVICYSPSSLWQLWKKILAHILLFRLGLFALSLSPSLSVSRFCYNFVIVLAWLTTEAVPNCLHMCEKHFGQHNLWSCGGGWESNLRKLIQLECGKYVELFAATLLLSSTCCFSSSSSLLQLCILANNSSLFFVTKISCWVVHFCN